MMNAEDSTGTTEKKRGLITLRRVNVLLALVIVGVLTTHWGELRRRIEYWRTGSLRIDGQTIGLDPDDWAMTHFILRDGSWEPTETALMRRLLHPGDTFVDVGANVGWYTLMGSAAVGSRGRVYAFEPDPRSRALMQRNIVRNRCDNVIVEGKALWDRRGTITLHINVGNKGNHSVIKGNLENPEEASIEVEAISLDEYVADHPGEIALVKIDTEGAEGSILEGMRATMRAQPRMAVILEFNPAFILRAGFDPEVMLRRFSEAGYAIHDINEKTGRLEPVDGARIAEFVRSVPYATNLLVRRPQDGSPLEEGR